MNHHSNGIVQFCGDLFNPEKSFELAQEHRFIERASSKLRGHEFIKAMVMPSEGLSTDSLKGLCNRIREFNPDADISSQALCERINDISAVNLMKGVFAQILAYMQDNIKKHCPALQQVFPSFPAILIEDSTPMTLNERLQESFQGTNRGGKGTKSQIKIDLIYDVAKNCTKSIELYNGNVPDQGLADRITKYIDKGSLVIRDLGYFALDSLLRIVEMEAFFLSRYQPNVKIFLNKEDNEPLDLHKYLARCNGGNIIEIPNVYLGAEKKICCRLILYRLPQAVVEKRRREANKRAKETGRKMSASKKISLEYAMFLTNVPEGIMKAKIVGTVYRLRWEIELVFKRWKSQLNIEYLKGIHPKRIECLVWSRLCTILIIEIITNYVARKALLLQLTNRELSHVKVLTYILRRSKFIEAVIKNMIEEFMNEMEEDIPRMLLKDSRSRKTMRERIHDLEAYYETEAM